VAHKESLFAVFIFIKPLVIYLYHFVFHHIIQVMIAILYGIYEGNERSPTPMPRT
jgi:hypothetical protein